MSVPITPAGNPEAATVAEESNIISEYMGEGHVMGNLVEDPDMRFTPTGRPTCTVRIAYTPRVKNDDGQGWHDGPTEFYNIIVWGAQSERAAEHLQRGDRIVAAGTWTKRHWRDREDQPRETIELTARDIGPSLLFYAAIPQRPDKPARQAAARKDS